MANTALLKRTFGERMAKARKSINQDQAEMAAALNVSRRTVVRWENDDAMPRADYVERWAEITGVPLMWLFFDDQGVADTGSDYRGYLPYISIEDDMSPGAWN